MGRARNRVGCMLALRHSRVNYSRKVTTGPKGGPKRVKACKMRCRGLQRRSSARVPRQPRRPSYTQRRPQRAPNGLRVAAVLALVQFREHPYQAHVTVTSVLTKVAAHRPKPATPSCSSYGAYRRLSTSSNRSLERAGCAVGREHDENKEEENEAGDGLRMAPAPTS